MSELFTDKTYTDLDWISKAVEPWEWDLIPAFSSFFKSDGPTPGISMIFLMGVIFSSPVAVSTGFSDSFFSTGFVSAVTAVGSPGFFIITSSGSFASGLIIRIFTPRIPGFSFAAENPTSMTCKAVSPQYFTCPSVNFSVR